MPPKTDTTVVSVTVDRNLEAPTLEKEEYTVEIDETEPLGVPFIQVGPLSLFLSLLFI